MPQKVLPLGQVARAIFLCAICTLIVGSGLIKAAPLLNLSRSDIAYGRTGPAAIVQPVFVTNVGDAPLTLSGLALSGKNTAEYAVGGTCTIPSTLLPGDRCRVEVTGTIFSANSSATLTVQSDSAPTGATVALSGSGADIDRGVFATPAWIDFDHQPVGVAALPQTLTITNPEKIGLIFESVAFTGGAAADFTLTSGCTIGKQYADNVGCSATIGFTPSASGPRSTQIVFSLHPGFAGPGYVTVSYSVTGVGGVSVATPVTVVEYYNASLDHYFITWIAAEQANLDAGNTPTKWTRTGYSFHAYLAPLAGTSPVCRYYLPPAFGDSHFFGRGTAECNATGIAHPAFVLEDLQFMDLFLPLAGACPATTVPIYRVFSNRPDANHRYMTDRGVRDLMVVRGWLAEGDGPDLVVMCAPP